MTNTMLDGRVVDEHGTVMYYKYGKLHREDGPAIEYSDGDREWWVDGNYIGSEPRSV